MKDYTYMLTRVNSGQSSMVRGVSGRDLTLECGPEVSLKSGRKCKSNSLESVQGHRPAPRIEPVEYATPLEVFDQENGVLATGQGEVSINPPGQFGQEIVCNSFGLCASI